MKWFRFYHDAIDDPKVQRLPGDLFKFWVNIMCLASRSSDRGLVKLDLEAIAFATRTTDTEAAGMIADLVRRNLLEENAEGYEPHNWESRQFKSDNVTERVQKHRSNAASDGVDVSETLHETLHETLKPSVNTDSDTETETEERRGGGATAPSPPPEPAKPEKNEPKKRAHRIPEDFSITDDMRQWAIERGASAIQVEHETEKFVNYWTAESGAKASKLNWCAAWKVWMGRNLPGSVSPNGSLTVHAGGKSNGRSNGEAWTDEQWAEWRRARGIGDVPGYRTDEPGDVIDVKASMR